MSDEAKTAPKGWTDTEKWGLVLQIIARMGQPIPWDQIDLPEGRTQKGCVVMLDKEKKKIREAMAAEGKELLPFKAKSTPKKRTKETAGGNDEGEEGIGSPKKKKPTPRKKKAAAKATEEDGEDDEAEKTAVKAEPADENGDEELV